MPPMYVLKAALYVILLFAALNLGLKNASAQEGLHKIKQCTGGDGSGGRNMLLVTYGLDRWRTAA